MESVQTFYSESNLMFDCVEECLDHVPLPESKDSILGPRAGKLRSTSAKVEVLKCDQCFISIEAGLFLMGWTHRYVYDTATVTFTYLPAKHLEVELRCRQVTSRYESAIREGVYTQWANRPEFISLPAEVNSTQPFDGSKASLKVVHSNLLKWMQEGISPDVLKRIPDRMEMEGFACFVTAREA